MFFSQEKIEHGFFLTKYVQKLFEANKIIIFVLDHSTQSLRQGNYIYFILQNVKIKKLWLVKIKTIEYECHTHLLWALVVKRKSSLLNYK